MAASLLAAISACTTPKPATPTAYTADRLKATSERRVPDLGGVALLVEREGKHHFCNAVALSPRLLISAAHCCIGRVAVIPSPAFLEYWDAGKRDPVRLARDGQVAKACVPVPGPKMPELDVHTLPGRSGDLALISLNLPLPGHVVPARRLAPEAIVKKAPIVDLKKTSFTRLFQLQPSDATADVSQYVPPDRFVGYKPSPLVATLHILGFDVKDGLLVLAPNAHDVVQPGTSGAGVFVTSETGEPRLLAVTVAGLMYRDEWLALAVDVRPKAAWIDAELAKGP